MTQGFPWSTTKKLLLLARAEQENNQTHKTVITDLKGMSLHKAELHRLKKYISIVGNWYMWWDWNTWQTYSCKHVITVSVKLTFSIVSMTIFLYCSFSSFRSSTILLIISDAPTLFANSTVVSTSCRKKKKTALIVTFCNLCQWTKTKETEQASDKSTTSVIKNAKIV